jgi:hypothetical protein
MANGRPAEESIWIPRETRQYYMSAVPAAPWLMTPYGIRQQSFGEFNLYIEFGYYNNGITIYYKRTISISGEPLGPHQLRSRKDLDLLFF